MNIFRLTGDLSHLAAIIILLLKIWKSRSCAGERNPKVEFILAQLHVCHNQLFWFYPLTCPRFAFSLPASSKLT